MDFIRSNKSLIIGILIGMFVLGAIFFVSTQTGLFDEDERMFSDIEDNVDESGEVIVDENDDSNTDSATGITEAPEEIEGFVDLPSDVDGNDINEDGTFNTIEDEASSLWNRNGLMPEDGDSSALRDLKDNARVTVYEDYQELKEMGLGDVEQNKRVELGRIGFTPKDDLLFKNDDVVDFGEIRITGANIDANLANVVFDVENTSGELLDMTEIQSNLQFRFVNDFGLGTEWRENDYLTYTSIEDFNNEGGTMDNYIGRNLTRTFGFNAVNEENIAEGLYLNNTLPSESPLEVKDMVGVQLGKTYEHVPEDVREQVRVMQDSMPEQLELEVRYKDETDDYVLLKTDEDMRYNYEER